MIASPSDLSVEREIARNVVYEWNVHESHIHQMVLLPVMWETHSVPDYGERPQAALNRQLLVQCDLLVAIFWTRLGTPTGRSRIWNSGGDRDIREFQTKAHALGLVGHFDSPEAFKEMLRQHLLGKLRAIGALDRSESPGSGSARRLEEIPQPSLLSAFGPRVRRFEVEWGLFENSGPGAFQRGKEFLPSLRSFVADGYSDALEAADHTAATLLRSALDQIVRLEGFPITHDQGHRFWSIGRDIFDLLRRAAESLKSRTPPETSRLADGRRRILRRLLSEARANAELLRTESWSTAAEVLMEAYAAHHQGPEDLPGDLGDLLDSVYSRITRAKNVHESVRATPGDATPELVRISNLLGEVRQALPDLIQRLERELG